MRRKDPEELGSELLVSKRHQWIDAQGTPGRNVACSESDEGQGNADAGEGQRICGAHTEKKLRHQTGKTERGGDAHADSQKRHSGSLSEHQPKDVAPLCAKSDAHSDFMRTLANEVRNHAVDSRASERQRERGKHAE